MSRRSKSAMWFFRHAPWSWYPTMARRMWKVGARLTPFYQRAVENKSTTILYPLPKP